VIREAHILPQVRLQVTGVTRRGDNTGVRIASSELSGDEDVSKFRLRIQPLRAHFLSPRSLLVEWTGLLGERIEVDIAHEVRG